MPIVVSETLAAVNIKSPYSIIYIYKMTSRMILGLAPEGEGLVEYVQDPPKCVLDARVSRCVSLERCDIIY